MLARAIRGSRGAGAERGDRPTPEQLLAERYARGEIDDAEYHRRLDTLAGRAQMSPRL